jgi:uroporphyrinogen-III synthase
MRVIITRPEPDALKLKARIENLEHEVVLEPLTTLSFDEADLVDLTETQALIATSRNGLRGLKVQGAHTIAAKLPLFVVGPGTAETARKLGFELILAGKGTARDLVPEIVGNVDPQAGMLVHLAGDRLAFDLSAELEEHGFRISTPVVYRMLPAATLTRSTLEQIVIGDADAVMLLSPRTADIWVSLVRKHGVVEHAARMTHLCLSAAVARRLAALGRPVRSEIAATPTLEDMLSLLR